MRHIAPALEGSEIRALAQLSSMSPGLALELHEHGALEVYEGMLDILATMPVLDTEKIHAFSDALTSGKQHANWQLFMQLSLSLFSRVALYGEGVPLDAISDHEMAVLAQLNRLHSAALWAEKWQQVAEQFLLVSRLHLDYKQSVIAFYHSIPTRDGLQIGTAA